MQNKKKRWRIDLIIIIKDLIIKRNNYRRADSKVLKNGRDYLGNVWGIFLHRSPITQGLGDWMR